jgi:hypothetical protein
VGKFGVANKEREGGGVDKILTEVVNNTKTSVPVVVSSDFWLKSWPKHRENLRLAWFARFW